MEYRADTSSQTLAKSSWILSPKTALESDTEFDLALVGSLYGEEGELASNKEYRHNFHTFGEFKFLGLSCEVSDKEKLLSVESSKEELQKNRCDPLAPISLVFSSPVSQKSVAEFVEFSPKLNFLADSYNPWENLTDNDSFDAKHKRDKVYMVRLPNFIKADSTHTLDTKKLKDIFGQELQGRYEISFMTDHRKPNLTLGYSEIVLEKGVHSDAALFATNLKNIKLDFIRFNENADKNLSYTHNIKTMNVKDIAYKAKMDIKKALDGKSGILYGDVKSDSYKHSSNVLAQVTPFGVHAKFGHFNTLIWVNTFSDAKPVKDAKITLYYGAKKDLNTLSRVTEAKLSDVDGRTILEGRGYLEEKLKKDYNKQFFVHVKKGEDEALLPLNYDYRIYNSEIYDCPRDLGEHAKVWGTTPQGVYKLGDSVSYKIYHRDQNNTKITQGAKEELFDIKVYDPLNAIVHQTKESALSSFATLDGRFELGKKAVSGNYRFEVENKKTGHKWYPLEILVSDFTPAPFRVMTQLSKSIYAPNDEVRVSTYATMFSGGAFSHAPVRINTYLQEENFVTNDPLFKDFNFLNPSYTEKTLIDVRENLDAKGEHTYSFKLRDEDISYGTIVVEASVEDDRGKVISAYTKANYAQKDRFVGLKNTKWTYKKSDRSNLLVVVLDRDKKPIKGVDVDVEIEYKEYRSARVKGSGNAFIAINSSEWIKESKCSVVTTLEPKECSFVPKHTGTYRFSATIKDTNNRPSTTEIYAWVEGEGSSVWSQSNDATLEIVAQKATYKIGERAKYLVKNPFEITEALITVERYGVLDSWVETFTTSTPIVEFEVKEEYLPGFLSKCSCTLS